MYKNFIIVLFLVFSLSLFSTEASNKNRIKADEFFIKGEWIEASEIYNTLIVMNKGDISLYAPVIGCTLIPYCDVTPLYPGIGHIIAPPT